MKELIVGIRFSVESGFAFFGLEQVDAEIDAGLRIVAIQQGDVLLSEANAGDSQVEVTFSGATFKVVMDR